MSHALLLLWLLMARPSTPPMALDDCGFHFGDQLLQVGMDTTAWYNILGRPDRVMLFNPGTSHTYHIWDRLGIMLKPSRDPGKFNQVGEVFFFFLDLDSPDGQAGIFKDHVNSWQSYPGRYGDAEARRDSLDGRSADYIQLFREAAEQTLYAYPLQPLTAPISLHGSTMQPGFDFARLNRLRHKKGLDAFIPNHNYARNFLYPPYRNRYGNGKVPAGIYHAYPKQVCADKAFYWELAYSELHHPIYLKLGQLEWGEWKRISAYLTGPRPN